jgi:hypothetical protein
MAAVDLTEFEALNPRKKKAPCKVAAALAALERTEGEKLLAACAADVGAITNTAICQWLAARGHDISIQRMMSLRRQTCDSDG